MILTLDKFFEPFEFFEFFVVGVLLASESLGIRIVGTILSMILRTAFRYGVIQMRVTVQHAEQGRMNEIMA